MPRSGELQRPGSRTWSSPAEQERLSSVGRRDPLARALHERGRPRVPDALPCRPHALRRRGAAHRPRLAPSAGPLTGTLYVLDEPTIGLHAADTRRLLDDPAAAWPIAGQHGRRRRADDPEVIEAADRVIDLGPGAGSLGGHLLFERNSRRPVAREVLRHRRPPAAPASPEPLSDSQHHNSASRPGRQLGDRRLPPRRGRHHDRRRARALT